jgi:integrase
MDEEQTKDIVVKDEDTSNHIPINSKSNNIYSPNKKRGPRKVQRIYESPTEEEFAKLIAIPKKLILETGYVLAAGCGMRLGEVLNLQPEDVDLKLKRIFIRQGKGSKDRIVNTPKWLKEKHVKCLPIKITARAIEASFLRHSMKAGINKIIGYYTAKGKQIPIYKYHFHSLRHFFATRAIEKGLPLNFLQSILGHQNLATTSRYTKANPVDAIQAVMDKGI